MGAIDVIRGTKATLRALEEGDLPHLQTWFNDAELSLARGSRRTARGSAMMLEWLDAVIERAGEPAEGVCLGIVDVRGRLVGLAESGPVDPIDRQAEVSLLIGRSEDRGKGLGREAMFLLQRHLFDDLGVHKLRTLVVADDARAVAYNRAVGFVEEGRLRQHRFLQGAWRDMLAMGLLAEEFRSRAGGA